MLPPRQGKGMGMKYLVFYIDREKKRHLHRIAHYIVTALVLGREISIAGLEWEVWIEFDNLCRIHSKGFSQ